jgi:hypothetical protein
MRHETSTFTAKLIERPYFIVGSQASVFENTSNFIFPYLGLASFGS